MTDTDIAQVTDAARGDQAEFREAMSPMWTALPQIVSKVDAIRALTKRTHVPMSYRALVLAEHVGAIACCVREIGHIGDDLYEELVDGLIELTAETLAWLEDLKGGAS